MTGSDKKISKRIAPDYITVHSGANSDIKETFDSGGLIYETGDKEYVLGAVEFADYQENHEKPPNSNIKWTSR